MYWKERWRRRVVDDAVYIVERKVERMVVDDELNVVVRKEGGRGG